MFNDNEDLREELKEVWCHLSKDNRKFVANKAQRSLSYISHILYGKDISRVKKDTLYDICAFSREQLRRQNEELEEKIDKYEMSND